jgi:protoheme IX farnesyltransferase
LPVLGTLPFNPALSFWLLVGAIIYVGIYTIWLKPRTLLNIVIGGAAGSAAVLSGAAAAGTWNDPGALVLAAILFLWTPFHFWSLAILYREEYQRADVPMLPAHTSPKNAAWWVMSHTAPTALLSLLFVVLPGLGWIYLIPVSLVTADLLVKNVRLILDPSKPNARALFMSSNYYLLVLLLAICIDMALPW